jgi:hypothetical protein
VAAARVEAPGAARAVVGTGAAARAAATEVEWAAAARVLVAESHQSVRAAVAAVAIREGSWEAGYAAAGARVEVVTAWAVAYRAAAAGAAASTRRSCHYLRWRSG